MITIPNLLTLFRILLVPAVVYCLVIARYDNALLLLAMGGITDYLDGYIARNFKSRSRLGSILDPIADKVLVNVVFVTLAWLDGISAMLVALVLLRDLVLICGAAYLHFLRRRRFEVEPTFVGKSNTFFQLLLIVAVIVRLGWDFAWLDWPIHVCEVAVAVLTLVSWVQYYRTGRQILKWTELSG